MTTTPLAPQALLSELVAEEIRGWMGRRRITGAKLARALGVSPAWVSYRLTGTQPIDLNDLQRIAGVLAVAPADLLPASAQSPKIPITAQYRAGARRTRITDPNRPSTPRRSPRRGTAVAGASRPAGRVDSAGTAPGIRRPVVHPQRLAA